MLTRRATLKLIGGGTVLAAGGAGAFIATNGPSHSARQAWRDAGLETEYRRRALSYALLAPNPHNRQPWLVELEGDNGLALYCDLARRLPATDPFNRQITIGCGAFLELLSIAAAEDGFRADIEPFPEGEPRPRLDRRPVARVRFVPGAAKPDPAFAHILARRTNREVFDSREVDAASLAQLAEAGSLFGAKAETTGDGALSEKLRKLTWAAHKVETTTAARHEESMDLMRIGSAEVNRWRDGLVLEGPTIELGRLMGIVTRKTLLDPDSTAFKQGLDMYEAKAMSARAFWWLTSADVTRSDELSTGRAYARFNLKAAELGVAVHPWSQSLQEYPEMADLYAKVHGLIGEGRRVQMLVRVGYAKPVIAAPRRGVDALFKA